MRYGWKKDPYFPQLTHTDHLVKMGYDFSKPIPKQVSLEYLLPDVIDQYQVGRCVGCGIAGNLTARAKEQGVFQEWFSPDWFYNGARYKEGMLSKDEGATPSDAWDWAVEKGCLLWTAWPCTPKFDKRSPPSEFDPEAAKFPCTGYCRVDNGVKGLMLALSVGNLISIGTPWPATWEDIGPDGILPDITEDTEMVGGHETFLGGYKEIEGKPYFRDQNSWGKTWADGGRCWMPASAFKVFKLIGGYDSHFPILPWKK